MFIISMKVKGVNVYYTNGNKYHMSTTPAGATVYSDYAEVENDHAFMKFVASEERTEIKRVEIDDNTPVVIKIGARYLNRGMYVGDRDVLTGRDEATVFNIDDAKFFASNHFSATVVVA